MAPKPHGGFSDRPETNTRQHSAAADDKQSSLDQGEETVAGMSSSLCCFVRANCQRHIAATCEKNAEFACEWAKKKKKHPSHLSYFVLLTVPLCAKHYIAFSWCELRNLPRFKHMKRSIYLKSL